MFNVELVQQGLKNLRGFKQTRTADIEKLKDFLLETDSGEYYNGVHPLIKMVNIDASAPDFDSYETQAYSGTGNYLKGEIVEDTGTPGSFFRSLQGTNTTPNNGNALTDTDFWEPFDYLSGYLEDVVLEAIPKMIKKVFAEKKKVQNMKELLADLKLYQGAGSTSSRITKSNRFCGFEIDFKYMKDLVMSVPKIGIQADTQQTLPIYIYHSSQVEPIYTFNIVVNKDVSFGWYDLLDSNQENPVLKFVNNSIQAGGSFYIGYYEQDLTGSMIKHKIDLSRIPCGGCSPINQRLYKSWNQYIEIHPFSVAEDFLDYAGNKDLWDTEKNGYTYDTNWGLNLSLNLKCDLTDFIIRNKLLFSEALGLQVAHDLVYEMAYSTENNHIAEKNRKLALYELDDRENQQGLISQLESMYKALEVDLSNLNSKCLPEKSNNGISYSAV